MGTVKLLDIQGEFSKSIIIVRGFSIPLFKTGTINWYNFPEEIPKSLSMLRIRKILKLHGKR